MNLQRILCSALLVSGLASTTWARDVCLEHPFGQYIVLRKVKSLHPGGSVPLTGFYYYVGGGPAAAEGSAMMKGDGTVVAGLFVHALQNNNNFTFEWTTDTTFAGSLTYDFDGDFKEDGANQYNAVDCTTLTLP